MARRSAARSAITGMISPEQMLAARALLRWTREDLAAKSGIATLTALGFELRRPDPKVSTVQRWRRTFEAAGIEFIDPTDGKGGGVRFRDAKAEADAAKRAKR